MEANLLSWGAFVAIGLRRRGLTRYRRGIERDVLALPAVFPDAIPSTVELLEQIEALEARMAALEAGE